MNKCDLLVSLAGKYENEEFLKGDPSWFMHQVNGSSNQELLAFVASSLSYGKREQFFPKIQKILDFSHGDVYDWVKNGDFQKDIPDNDQCYYRLYSNHKMRKFLMTLRDLLDDESSLGAFVKHNATDGYTAIEAITGFFNRHSATDIIPRDTSSACKRICMFLRWMVRDNSPVDLGLWNFIDKRTLILPLDTHVLAEAHRLGFLGSLTSTMSTARKLTAQMANIFPDDPTKADFALFGYGISHQQR
jgi:uncharacterized protein (TIGR02757 family)